MSPDPQVLTIDWLLKQSADVLQAHRRRPNRTSADHLRDLRNRMIRELRAIESELHKATPQ